MQYYTEAKLFIQPSRMIDFLRKVNFDFDFLIKTDNIIDPNYIFTFRNLIIFRTLTIGWI